MVSFIVPCYNYAYFLGECVSSILRQSYPRFEVLIMDDHSPDNTPEVARSFADPRVVHIRNERNLGLVANINKALGLAQGEYVWPISADDKLRDDCGLERYARFIDKHPEVGFVFSPVIPLREGKEDAAPLSYSNHGPADKRIKAPEMGYKALDGCPVCGPSVMIRKSCFLEAGGYRQELPRNADWYLFGALGMAHDVGYVAEPAANFRFHGSSLDHEWKRQSPEFCRDQDIATLQLLSRRAEALGLWTLAWAYQAQIPRALVRLGRQAYHNGLLGSARENFRLALNYGSQRRRAYTGLFWVSLGKPGCFLKSPLKTLRHLFAKRPE
ncbi:MAG: hypothetical protein DME19_15000 [Verrucomicrobia bacterium]|nr:MAG: hypothetical protein DME19_15000 [Verrucomicrobiota bacterium]